MAIPDNPLYWQVGADPRCTGRTDENSFGRIRTNDLSIYGYLTSMRQWYNPSNIANVPSAIQPYVVASAPYTVDDNGLSFPGGTVWIACTTTGEGTAPVPIRLPGQGGTKTITVFTTLSGTADPWRGSIPVDVVYYATGLSPTSSGVITVYENNTSGSVVGTFSVSGANGPNVEFLASALFTSGVMNTGPSPGPVSAYAIQSVWTGAVPRFEQIKMQESGHGTAFIAVPGSSVPSGYTARTDLDTDRGGSYQLKYQADPRRAVETCIPIGHLGLAGLNGVPDGQLGLPVFATAGQSQSLWINDQCCRYTWMPIAVGTAVISGGGGFAGAQGIPSPPPPGILLIASGGPPVTTLGARGGVMTLTYHDGKPAFNLGPNDTETVTIKINVDGSTVYTNTLGGAAAISGCAGTYTLPAMLPGVLGNTCVIQLQVTVTGTVAHSGSTQLLENWQVGISISLSPRCDIPIPWTCTNGLDATQVYPGAYLPSAVGAGPVNSQPLTTVSGTTFTVGTTPVVLVFTPTANGWYQVTNGSGTPQPGIGENEFGYYYPMTIARGHNGRLFYALGAASTFYSLNPFTPSLTPIASGGTTFDLSTGPNPFFGFGWISFPSVGLYQVQVSIIDAAQLLSGLIVRTSASDPSLLTYDRSIIWETLDEFAGTLFSSAQVLNDPPVTPSNTVAVIVGSTPTGAFIGHADALALWDDIQNQYQFTTPSETPFTSVAGAYWRYAGAWRTGTALALTFLVQVTNPGQVQYIGLECCSPLRSSPGRVQVGWVAM